MIADDTVLAKPRSKKIELVNDPYSGHAHDVMAGIGLINWLWHGLDIEVYHREIKQTCSIERCQARTGRAQRNFIFLAISAWVQQHKRRLTVRITLYSATR